MPVKRNSYVTLRFTLLAFLEVYYFIYDKKYIKYIIFLVLICQIILYWYDKTTNAHVPLLTGQMRIKHSLTHTWNT